MTFFVKLFLFISLYFFSSWGMASNSGIDDLVISGINDNKILNVQVNKACIGPFSRNLSPGPYQIQINTFKAIFDGNSRTLTKISRKKVEGAIFSFSDFKTSSQTQSTSTMDRLKASMGLPLPGQQFDFEDFHFSVPFREIHNSVLDLPSLKKYSFSDHIFLNDEEKDNFYTILGLEVVVKDKLQGSMIHKVKVAFATPSPYLGSNLIEDINLGSEALLFQLWPFTAVLHSNQRDFYAASGEHIGRPEKSDCTNSDFLDFEFNIVD